MREVKYDGAYMFKYSAREGTKAYSMTDDVSDEIKTKRLQEIIELQQQISFKINQKLVGKEETILIEGFKQEIRSIFIRQKRYKQSCYNPLDENIKQGNYVKVKINRATHATLFGDIVNIVTPVSGNFALSALKILLNI